MASVLGPIHPIAEDWGFVLEGETGIRYNSPVESGPLSCLFTGAGMQSKDLLVYEPHSEGLQAPGPVCRTV
jgi:hypothetical protein